MLSVGDRVEHEFFGIGTITNIRPCDPPRCWVDEDCPSIEFDAVWDTQEFNLVAGNHCSKHILLRRG